MKIIKIIATATLLLSFSGPFKLHAQERQFPLVNDFGGVYEVEGAVEMPDSNKTHKILIELVTASTNKEEPSFWINNIARMMNLHGVAGVKKANIQVKVVVHGGAVRDIVSDERYLKEFEVEKNPNLELLKALEEAGAEIIVCGQSLLSREIIQEELFPGTKVALSALTTITKNVPDGYVLMKF